MTYFQFHIHRTLEKKAYLGAAVCYEENKNGSNIQNDIRNWIFFCIRALS